MNTWNVPIVNVFDVYRVYRDNGSNCGIIFFEILLKKTVGLFLVKYHFNDRCVHDPHLCSSFKS